jgi:hypothetical protein
MRALPADNSTPTFAPVSIAVCGFSPRDRAALPGTMKSSPASRLQAPLLGITTRRPTTSAPAPRTWNCPRGRRAWARWQPQHYAPAGSAGL